MAAGATVGTQPEVWRHTVARPGKTATILLVEDEAFVRNVTCEVLQAIGYRVMCAKNSAEGSGLHERFSEEIELLITDVVLPGENGHALAERLQRRNPDLKVLLVTGYAEQMKFSGQGYFECLAKPFSSAALVERMQRLLDPTGFRV